MSNSVDQRIVQMQFDNAQFERGVGTTLASLKALDQTLQMKTGVSGLELVDAAAAKLNFAELVSDVNDLNDKFSALGVIGFNAISRVANAIMDLGAGAIQMITLDPLNDGLDEYKLKMDSITTIMANTKSKGTSLDDVNATLAELNDYADQTIYNFAEMTRNIGTFTAAGVDLKTSASAIKGIANLAAVSGSNSQQASVAMYQLSQALASGTVKLMDWNSVLNAGMGGQIFQDALVQTAEHLGTGAKAAIEAEGSFRESLKTGWLTSEVLTETLNQFTMLKNEENRAHLQQLGYTEEEIAAVFELADTATKAATEVKTFQQLIDTTKEALGSGWATSWEYIIGNMDQAKELWTKISEVINGIIDSMSNPRNDFLKTWNESGGWEALKDTIFEIGGLISDFLIPVGEAFNNVFKDFLDPIAKGEAAAEASKNLLETVKAIKKFLAESEVARVAAILVRTAFTAVFEVIKLIGMAVGGTFLVAFKAIGFVFKTVVVAVETVLQAFKKLYTAIVSFANNKVFKPLSDFLTNILHFESLGQLVRDLGSAFAAFFSSIADGDGKKLALFKNLIDENIKEDVAKIAERVGKALGFFGKKLSYLLSIAHGTLAKTATVAFSKLRTVWSELLPVLEKIRTRIGDVLGPVIEEAFARASGVLESLKTYVDDNFAGVLERVGASLSVLGDGLSYVFSAIKGSVGKIALNILDKLEVAWEHIVIVLEKVRDRVLAAWTFIGNAFSEAGFSLDPLMELFDGFAEAFGSFLDRIVNEGFSLDALLELFGSLGEQIKTFAEEAGPPLIEFVSAIKEAIGEELGDALSNLGDWLANIDGPLSSITSALSNLVGSITSLGDSFTSSFGGGAASEGVSQFSEMVEGAGDTVENFNRVIEMLWNPFNTIQYLVSEGLKGLAKGINDFIDSISGPELANLISKLGDLSILAGVGAGLYEFYRMVSSLSNLAVSAERFFKSMGKVSDYLAETARASKTLVRAQALLTIVMTIGVVVGALYLLTKMDLDKVDAALPILAKIGAGIVIMMLGFSVAAAICEVNASSLMAMSGVIMSIVAVLLALVGITAILGAMPESVVEQGEAAVAGIVRMLTLLLVVLGVVTLYAPKVSKSSVVMLEIAGALGIVAGIVILLGAMPQEVLKQGGLVAGLIVGVLTVLALIVSHFGGKSFTVGAAGLIELAGAISIMAGAILLLSLGNSEKILAATNAIGILILILGVFTAVVSGIKPARIQQAAASLIVLSVSIGIIAAALAGLALVSHFGGDIAQGLIAISVIMIGLYAMISALSGVEKKFKKAAMGVLVLAGAVTLLTAALVVLSMMNPEEIGIALLELAGVMLIVVAGFGAVSAIANFARKGLIALTAVLLAVGVAVLAFGVSAALFVGALVTMSQLSPEAVDNIITAFQHLCIGIWESTDEMALAMMGLGQALTYGILGMIPGIIEAVFIVLGEILGALIVFAPLVGEGAILVVAGIVDGIATGIEEHGPKLVEAFDHLGKACWEAFTGALSQPFDNLNHWLYDITGGGMGYAPKEAGESGKEVANAYGEGAESQADEVAKSFGVVGDSGNEQLAKSGDEALAKASETVHTLSDILGVPVDVGELDTTNLLISGGKAVEDLSEKGSEASSGFISSANAKLEELGINTNPTKEKFETDTVEVADAGANAFEEEWQSETGEMDLSDGMAESVEDQEGFARSAEANAEAANDAYASNTNIVGITSEKVNAALSELNRPDEFSEASSADAEATSRGFEGSMGDFVGAASTAVNSALYGLSGFVDRFKRSGDEMGSAMTSGVADGMWRSMYKVSIAATAVANAAASAIATASQIASPSKVTRRLGKFMAEGFALGMLDNADRSAEAAEKLAEASMSAMMSQVSYLVGLLEEVDEQPVITPVLDLSQIESGLNRFDNMLPDTQLIAEASAALARSSVPVSYGFMGMSPRGFFGEDSQSNPFDKSKRGDDYEININLNYDASDDAAALARGVARKLGSIMDMRG